MLTWPAVKQCSASRLEATVAQGRFSPERLTNQARRSQQQQADRLTDSMAGSPLLASHSVVRAQNFRSFRLWGAALFRLRPSDFLMCAAPPTIARRHIERCDGNCDPERAIRRGVTLSTRHKES